jgi:YVTN family beta-propeller protein
MNLSPMRLSSCFAPLAPVFLGLVSLTGFAQEPVSNSLPKNQIVATIPLRGVPSTTVVSPDSKFVYAANFVVNSFTTIVQVIDASTNTITGTITLNQGSGLPDILTNTAAITPDGSTLYVTEFLGTTIWVIDTASQQVTTTLTVSQPEGLAVTPDGTQLYVCNIDGTVTVIDTATNQITNTIEVGRAQGHLPWDVAFTPNGKKAYIAAKPNGSSRGKNKGYLAVIDTATQSVVASLLLTTGQGFPATPPIEAMAPNGRHLFYSQEKSIPVISTSSNQVVRTLQQSFSHLPAAITPNGKYLYMASEISGDTFNGVSTVESASGSVVGQQIPLPYPSSVVIAPNGKFAYVITGVGSASSLYVVDISPQ